MANEISFSTALTFTKAGVTAGEVARAVTDELVTVDDDYYISGSFLADIVSQPLPLGQVTSPGWSWFKNLDATATISVTNAGTPFLSLAPGIGVWVPLDPLCVPYCVATAAGLLEYVVISA